jgi:glyoxylase-like metal-dependent hydrolase (beta-lactamase superfamily II)
MITVKLFTFNPFQENTYLLSDETKECIIIDAGMDGSVEEDEITSYISENGLKPVLLVNTHAHVDHILGNNFIAKKYNLELVAHKDSVNFIERAASQAQMFGMEMSETKSIDKFIDEGETLNFGNSSLQIFLTPGHADGSLCFYSEKDKFVITGDVLFNQSIGRTDLPTGNYDLLQKSIWEKLFTLPDETVAYPGHGPETTIGYEKLHNPFVAIGKEEL